MNLALSARCLPILLLVVGAWADPTAQASEPVAARATAATNAPPRLEIAQPKFDFGKVSQGDEVHHVFQIRNTGGSVLEITDVRPTCGCTTAGTWTRQLQPGEVGVIPLKLDTSRFIGSISKAIILVSNDPAQPERTVELNGVVWTPISIGNPVLIFPPASDPDVASTRATTLRNEQEGALRLDEPKSDNPHFKPQLREIVPGREFELVVSSVPPLPEGTQTARITVKSSSETMPVIAVQAVLTVLPPIQVAPAQIMFSAGKLAAPERRYAVILNHRKFDLQVTDLSTDAPGVTFATTLSQDGRQFTITLTFPAGFELEPGKSYFLRGKTNHPSTPAFEIPIVRFNPR